MCKQSLEMLSQLNTIVWYNFLLYLPTQPSGSRLTIPSLVNLTPEPAIINVQIKTMLRALFHLACYYYLVCTRKLTNSFLELVGKFLVDAYFLLKSFILFNTDLRTHSLVQLMLCVKRVKDKKMRISAQYRYIHVQKYS